jgi:hypothetical protein
MATTIYQTKTINLFDGTEIEISPLKIWYLRKFMDVFQHISKTKNDDEAILVLLECTRICMEQYYPEISASVNDVEDNIDMPTMHEILDVAAGIKINGKKEEAVKEQAESSESGNSWFDLDLAKLESEVFLVGSWKNYKELEQSICMSELMATIESKRELDYQEKRFFAAIQGVDLDKESGSEKGQKEWENLKARVFSKGQTNDSDDVLALQGQNAKKAGFGIGMGLDYEDARDPSVML